MYETKNQIHHHSSNGATCYTHQGGIMWTSAVCFLHMIWNNTSLCVLNNLSTDYNSLSHKFGMCHISWIISIVGTIHECILQRQVLFDEYKLPFPSVAWRFLVTVVVFGCRISSLAFSNVLERRSVLGHSATTSQPRMARIPRATFKPFQWLSQSLSDEVSLWRTQQQTGSVQRMQDDMY